MPGVVLQVEDAKVSRIWPHLAGVSRLLGGKRAGAQGRPHHEIVAGPGVCRQQWEHRISSARRDTRKKPSVSVRGFITLSHLNIITTLHSRCGCRFPAEETEVLEGHLTPNSLRVTHQLVAQRGLKPRSVCLESPCSFRHMMLCPERRLERRVRDPFVRTAAPLQRTSACAQGKLLSRRLHVCPAPGR